MLQSQIEAIKSKNCQKTQKVLQTKMQQKLPDKVTTSSSSSIKQYGGPRVLNFTMSNYNGMEKENTSPKKAIILNQKVCEIFVSNFGG